MVSLCGLLHLLVPLDLLLMELGFNGLKDLLAQLASPAAGGSSSPFFLADDQEVFFGNFRTCQIENPRNASGENRKKGPLRGPVIA